MELVLESKSEKGYWNNEIGWGALESATIFTRRDMIHFPISRSDDTILTRLSYAKENRVDLDW